MRTAKGSGLHAQPVKEYVRPARQLHLSPAELAEEVVCNLSAANPLAPANTTRYIPREHAFKCDIPAAHASHRHCTCLG
jgi:hypothetical protein